MVDLNYHSQYQPSIGFRFNIEAIHDNNVKGFFAIFGSIMPPASYYDPKREPGVRFKESFYIYKPQYDSTHQSFRFDEGDEILKEHSSDKPGMAMMIDIKVYMPDKDSFEDYGYTVCPLIEELETDNDESTHEFYVNSGIYSLPIYKGKPSPQIIDRIILAEFPIIEM